MFVLGIERRELHMGDVFIYKLTTVLAWKQVDFMYFHITHHAFVCKRAGSQYSLNFTVCAPQKVFAWNVGPQHLTLLASKTLSFHDT